MEPEVIEKLGFMHISAQICVSLSVIFYSFATPWTVACQSPLSVEFSRQEYWSG